MKNNKLISMTLLLLLISCADGTYRPDDVPTDFVVAPLPTEMVTVWRATGAFDTITLPLVGGYNYTAMVNWGDGTPDSEITSSGDLDKTHTYDVAGDYVVTITGLMEAWSFGGGGDYLKIISVTDFGALGWVNLYDAFLDCINLVSFAGGKTENVINMAGMFGGTTALTSLDLSSFDTSAVLTMNSMFNNVGLTSLDLTSFNTSAVTDMNSMFMGNPVLSSINFTNFKTGSVTDMGWMFESASALTSLNLSSFNTSAVTNMGSMFKDTTALTALDADNWDIGIVGIFGNIFTGTGVVVDCDQGGSPGTGTLFGKTCN